MSRYSPSTYRMSGAQARELSRQVAGTSSGWITSPAYSQVTRSVERRIGRMRSPGSPWLLNTGFWVPYAYQAPSLPRITAGSGKVSVTPAVTGFA